MLNIFICDDEKMDADNIQKTVQGWCDQQKKEVNFRVCRSADEATAFLTPDTPFDLYFLDIMLGGESGIALGRRVRALFPRARIVYTTSSPEFALEAFGVHAFRYLLKPVNPAEVSDLMDEACSVVSVPTGRTYIFKTHNGIRGVLLEEILYAENFRRSVVLVLHSGERLEGVSTRVSFEINTAGLLERPEFVQTHKSFVVNMKYITRVRGDFVELDTGALIPISRQKASAVKKGYLHYLSELS